MCDEIAGDSQESTSACTDAVNVTEPGRSLLQRLWKTVINPALSFISRQNHTIHNQERRGFPIGRAGQLLLAVWSLLLLAGFSIAFELEPDPRGYGTHQGLGLPECTFRTRFGVGCPSCGMTTSFANFTRGQLTASVQANAAGFLMAIVCAVQIPWCWFSIYSRRLWKVERPDAWVLGLLAVLCSVCLIQWTVKLMTA